MTVSSNLNDFEIFFNDFFFIIYKITINEHEEKIEYFNLLYNTFLNTRFEDENKRNELIKYFKDNNVIETFKELNNDEKLKLVTKDKCEISSFTNYCKFVEDNLNDLKLVFKKNIPKRILDLYGVFFNMNNSKIKTLHKLFVSELNNLLLTNYLNSALFEDLAEDKIICDFSFKDLLIFKSDQSIENHELIKQVFENDLMLKDLCDGFANIILPTIKSFDEYIIKLNTFIENHNIFNEMSLRFQLINEISNKSNLLEIKHFEEINHNWVNKIVREDQNTRSL
ncbi:MAG: hypothetical protein ISQ32_05675 [Rickettsiales bacterium]|nr:hypothetical protein [Rickettsiales bacterium]